MADDIKKDEVVEDMADLTSEEKAEAWAKWVRSEVNSALDIYLPKALSGHINVKYYPHVKEMLESGPELDNNKADGVLLSIIFEFEEPVDLTKPRIEEDQE